MDNKKKIFFILSNILGLLVFVFGGVKLLAYITIAIVFFIIGKYTEKAISFVKDYRLQLKVNRLNITVKDVEKLKEENKQLKEQLNKHSSNLNKKHDFSLEDFTI